jgi:hypothetical protein
MAEFTNNLQSRPEQPLQAGPANPLTAFYRQPKIWISLPSKGEFYPDGALEKSSTGEYPVFAMTARDELLFKTPDALMNGAATTEVIKSCIPAIKNPWTIPSLDVDAILCAIRIATYGPEMDVTTTCPKCETVNDAMADLRVVLDNLNKLEFAKTVEIDNQMLVFLRPMTYEQITKAALKAFEHQRIFQIVNNENLEEQEKVRLFQESFIKLTDLTIDTAVNCISRIESSAGSTDNPGFIKEFLKNADKKVFETINLAVNKSQESGTMSSFHAKCEKCGHDWDVTLTLDSSDFFAQGFRR